MPLSVKDYLSGVKMLHIFHGLPVSISEDVLLQLDLQGISKLNGSKQLTSLSCTSSGGGTSGPYWLAITIFTNITGQV